MKRKLPRRFILTDEEMEIIQPTDNQESNENNSEVTTNLPNIQSKLPPRFTWQNGDIKMQTEQEK